MKSHFAEHLLTTEHEFSNLEHNLHILQFQRNKEKLNVQEDFHIYKNYKENHHNLLNTQIYTTTNPIFDNILRL